MKISIGDIAGVVVAVIVLLGAVAGLLSWFFKRGSQERASNDAIERNTVATEKLTQEMVDFKTVVVDMFHELDKRVTVLETTRSITTVVESKTLESKK